MDAVTDAPRFDSLVTDTRLAALHSYRFIYGLRLITIGWIPVTLIYHARTHVVRLVAFCGLRLFDYVCTVTHYGYWLPLHVCRCPVGYALVIPRIVGFTPQICHSGCDFTVRCLYVCTLHTRLLRTFTRLRWFVYARCWTHHPYTDADVTTPFGLYLRARLCNSSAITTLQFWFRAGLVTVTHAVTSYFTGLRLRLPSPRYGRLRLVTRGCLPRHTHTHTHGLHGWTPAVWFTVTLHIRLHTFGLHGLYAPHCVTFYRPAPALPHTTVTFSLPRARPLHSWLVRAVVHTDSVYIYAFTHTLPGSWFTHTPHVTTFGRCTDDTGPSYPALPGLPG